MTKKGSKKDRKSPQPGPAAEPAAPAASPGFLLWRATNRWQRHLRAALHETGLTHVQYALLAAARELADAGTPATQAALAAAAHTDVMMTSQVVRALERRRLLARMPHPTDRRARIVTVTGEGERLAVRAAHVVRDADQDFFAALGGKTGKFVKRLQRLATDPEAGET